MQDFTKYNPCIFHRFNADDCFLVDQRRFGQVGKPNDKERTEILNI